MQTKRILSLVMALCMLFTLTAPTFAWALEGDDNDGDGDPAIVNPDPVADPDPDPDPDPVADPDPDPDPVVNPNPDSDSDPDPVADPEPGNTENPPAAVAAVGEDSFTDFAKALAAALESGKVLELKANAAETVTLKAGETLKVKANGFSIEVQAAEGCTLATSKPDEDGVVTYEAKVEQPVENTRKGGDDTRIVVSDGFSQDAASYADSNNFYITSEAGLKYFRDLVSACDSGAAADDYASRFNNHSTAISWYTNNIFSGKTVHLYADIDLGNEDWTPIGYINKAFNDGESKTRFYGSFDGHDHTISNITVASSSNNSNGEYGFFGRLGAPAGQTISNLTLSNVTVSSGNYVGALIGNAGSNEITINNVDLKGTIALQGDYTGGLCGIGRANVQNCNVTGGSGSTISGISFAGGLVGAMRNGENLEVGNNTVGSVVVASSQYAGGLVGAMAVGASGSIAFSGNSIKSNNLQSTYLADEVICTNAGSTVTSTKESTTTTNNTIPITKISVTGNTNDLYMGTTLKLTASKVPANATEELGVVNWTSNGPAIATVDANGLVTPVAEGTTTIQATANGKTATYSVTVKEYTITWKLDADTVIDTTSVAYGIVPTHTDPTKDADTNNIYTFTGWTPEVVAATEDAVYTATFTVSQPSLDTWTGNGTSADPFRIATKADLERLATNVNNGRDYAGAYFKLTANIDLNGDTWTPIGTAAHPFSGVFDGDNKTISHLTITDGSYKALFGYVGGGSTTIQNVNLSNVNVIGEKRIAGLVAKVVGNATFTNCSIDANSKITGSDANIAGLIGEIYPSANSTITCTNLTNYAKVTGTGGESTTCRVAGICCQTTNAGDVTVHVTFTNCHNYGAISSVGAYAGGIMCAAQGANSTETFNGCSNEGTLTGAYTGDLNAYLTGNKHSIEIVNHTGNIASALCTLLHGSHTNVYYISVNGVRYAYQCIKDSQTVTFDSLINGAIEVNSTLLDDFRSFAAYLIQEEPLHRTDDVKGLSGNSTDKEIFYSAMVNGVKGNLVAEGTTGTNDYRDPAWVLGNYNTANNTSYDISYFKPAWTGDTLYKLVKTVKVTFNANDGAATPTTMQAVPKGVATALTANSFTNGTQDFLGWNTQADGSGTSYANSANVTLNDNTILYAQWGTYVAQIGTGDNAAKYTTLAAAIAAVATGNEIVMIADSTENVLYDVTSPNLKNKTITISGKKTLTSSSGQFGFYFGDSDQGNSPMTDKLTVSDITMAKSGGDYTALFDAVAADLTGVTINSNGNTGLSYANGATGTLTNVTVTNTGNHSSETWRNTALAVQSIAGNTVLTVNSGSYTSANGCAVYIFTSGGTVNIEGGTFSGALMAQIDNSSYPGKQAIINISGGTFTNCTLTESGGANAQINISGGYFSIDPTAYLAEGYTVVTLDSNASGDDGVAYAAGARYKVTELPPVANPVVTFQMTDSVGKIVIQGLDDNVHQNVFATWNDGVNNRPNIRIAFTQTVEPGGTATKPTNTPYYDYNITQPNNGNPKTFTNADSHAYTFDGWATADGELYDFTTPVTSDLVLHPRFSATGATIVIHNEAELRKFAREVELGRKFREQWGEEKQTVKLADDITLTSAWKPVAGFEGIFDGDNHSISGLEISATGDNAGFFSGLNSHTVVKDLTFVAPSVTSTDEYVGVLAGSASSNASTIHPQVSNVNVTGAFSVSGENNVGALIGQVNAGVQISNCHITGSNGTVTASGSDGRCVGGLLSNTIGAVSVTDCSVSGVTVTGYRKIGGLIGQVQGNLTCTDASVSNVTLHTNASTDYNNTLTMGGLVGIFPDSYSGSTISGTVSDITMTGPANIAGGKNYVMGLVSGGTGGTVEAAETAMTNANMTFNVAVSGTNTCTVKSGSTYAGINGVFAVTYDVWVGGTQIDAVTASNVFNDGKVSYDPTTKTLTLDGYTYSGAGHEKSAIYAVGDLNIVVTGTNSLTSTEASGFGIYTSGSLAVTGSGQDPTLNVTAAATGYAIKAAGASAAFDGVIMALAGNRGIVVNENNASADTISIKDSTIAFASGMDRSLQVWNGTGDAVLSIDNSIIDGYGRIMVMADGNTGDAISMIKDSQVTLFCGDHGMQQESYYGDAIVRIDNSEVSLTTTRAKQQTAAMNVGARYGSDKKASVSIINKSGVTLNCAGWVGLNVWTWSDPDVGMTSEVIVTESTLKASGYYYGLESYTTKKGDTRVTFTSSTVELTGGISGAELCSNADYNAVGSMYYTQVDSDVTVTGGSYGLDVDTSTRNSVNNEGASVVIISGGSLNSNGSIYVSGDSDDSYVTMAGTVVINISESELDWPIATNTLNIASGSYTIIGADEDISADTGNITGGIFSTDVTIACADGYGVFPNTDASTVAEYPYMVAPISGAVAKIDEIYYTTLPAAVAAAQAGDEIVLLDDVALSATQVIDKNLTIDLNGHNITATNARALWVKSGDVTITGTGTISAGGEGLAASSSVIRVGDKDANASAAKLTIDQNVTVSSAKSYGVTVFGVNNDNNSNTTDIELVMNGTVTVTGENPAISGNGTSTLSATAMTIAGTVRATRDNAIYHPGKGTLTVSGTVEGKGGIEIKSGTLTVASGASITATGTPSQSANQDGCSTSGYAIAAVSNVGYVGDPTVTINGGTITGTVAKLADNQAENLATVTATSSTITIPDGYYWKLNTTTNLYTLAKAVAVDDAGNYYASIEDAFAGAAKKATVTLLTDVEVSGNLNRTQHYNITINGNGHKITLSGDVTQGTDYWLFFENVTLDLNGHTYDNTGDFNFRVDSGTTIILDSSNPSAGKIDNKRLYVGGTGKLKIQSGTVNAEINSYGGEVEVSGGYVNILATQTNTPGTVVKVTGGQLYKLYMNAGEATISGGTIINTCYTGNATTTITGTAMLQCTAEIKNGGTLYVSGGTVKAEIHSYGGKVEVSGGNVNILNSKNNTPGTVVKVTGGQLNKLYMNAGEATISGGTIINTCYTGNATTTITGTAMLQCTAEIKNGGTLNVSGGTIAGGDHYAISSVGPNTIKISGGTLTSNTYAIVFYGPGEGSGSTATLDITGGSITGRTAISGNGDDFNPRDGKSDNGGTVINISGGTITGTSNNGAAIYHPQAGELNISGTASITGVTGIEMRDGTLNVSGGTITATGNTTSSTGNNSGTTTFGAGIAVAQHNTKKPITVSVTGGTISGYTPFVEVNPQGNSDEDLAKITLSISGGTFTTANGGTMAVSVADIGKVNNGSSTGFITGGTYSVQVADKYLAPGYYDPQVGEVYIVGEHEARIGNVGYTTLAAAVAAATDGANEIVLLDDVALTSTIDIAKDVTINLNGKNITAADCRALHIQSGTVTITGSGTISANGTGLDADSSVIRVGFGFSTSDEKKAAASLTIGENVTVSSAKSYGITVFGVNDSDNDNTTSDIALIVNGTVAVTGVNPAISGNGTSTLSATAMTIAGTVTATQDNAIYHPGKGTLTVSGTVEGKGGIEIKSGTLTVASGASIKANGTPSQSANQDGCSTSGYAIAAVSNVGYVGDPTVTIGGGTITGTVAKLADNQAENLATVTATSNEITIPADYKWVAQGTDPETYLLVACEYVAQIGETKYETLAAAIEAVPDNTATTITMIGDETINVATGALTIAAGKNVVIDLNGHTVTGYCESGAASALITNYGTLTINDSSNPSTGKLIAGATPTWTWDGTDNYAGSYASNLIFNSGTLTVESGHLENVSTGSACYAIDNNSSGGNAIATINGGVVKGHRVAIRQFANSTTWANTVNVAGGTVTGSYAGIWIQLPNSDATKAPKAELNVTGGTLEGEYAFYDYSYGNSFNETQCTLSGGTFDGDVFSFGANIDISGDATFNGEVCLSYEHEAEVSIRGGIFNDECDYGKNAATAFISGGIFFKKAVAIEDCVEGKIPIEIQSGDYTGKYSVGNGWKIFYEKNDASATGEMSVQLVAYTDAETAVTANLTTNAFARADYRFSGWNTAADGTGTPYADEAEISLTGDVTLYAQWDAILYVAQIGSTKYETLAAAIEAVPDNTATTITMIGDETIVGNAGVTISANKNVMLDLNGHTVSQIGPMADAGYLIKNQGTLTIKDSTDTAKNGTGSGKMMCSSENPDTGDIPSYANNLISNYGTLTIDSGYYQVLTNAGYASFVIDNYNGGTTNIQGGKLCNVAEYAYVVRQFMNSTTADNILNISGGEISGSYAVWMQYPNGNANKGTLSVTGGTITASDGCAIYAGAPGNWTRDASNVSVSFTGGTVGGSGVWLGADTPFKSIEVTDGSYASFGSSMAGGTGYITGGYFHNLPNAEYINPNYSAYETTYLDQDGWYRIGAAVAQIGNIGYTTLQAAVDAAADGDTVKLLVDLNSANNNALTSRVEVNAAGKAITIDLNGKTIAVTHTTGNGSAFNIKSGTVTIKNGTIDGTGVEEGQAGGVTVADGICLVTVRSGAVLNLVEAENEPLNMVINSKNGSCVYPFDGGTVNISGGTYENRTTEAYDYKTGFQGLTVNQANVATQLVHITGGTFIGNDPQLGDDNGAAHVDSGYVALPGATDGTFQVVAGSIVTFADENGTELQVIRYAAGSAVAYTGTAPAKAADADGVYTWTGWTNGTDNYATDAALPAATTTNVTYTATYASVTSVASITTGEPAVTTYYATLAEAIAAATAGDTVMLLGDYTVDRVIADNDAAYTLDLGGHTLTGRVTFYDGTVTVQNGTVVGRVDAYDSSNVTLAATATVNGQAVVWGDGTYGEANCKTPTLNVYSTITNYDGFAITTNGSDLSGASINIYDGAAVTSDEEAAIYLPSGNLTVYGGTITGSTGIFMRGGTLNVPAGSTATITGNGNPPADPQYSASGDGANSTGNALTIVASGYPAGLDASTITVAGGTFVSEHADAVGSYAQTDAQTAITGFISGGFFSSIIPDELCVPIKASTTDPDNNLYEVVDAWTVTFKKTAEDQEAFFVDKVAKGESIAAPTPAPTMEGRTFAKWLNNDQNVEFPFTPSANTTLIAKWDTNTYMVTVTSSGDNTVNGTAVAMTSGGGNYAFGAVITVKAYDASGYEFVGWYDKTGANLSSNKEYQYTVRADEENNNLNKLVAVYAPTSGNTFKLLVTGSKFTVTGYSATQRSRMDANIGANKEITVTFTGSENFLCWINASNKVVSRDPAYTFRMVQDTSLTAVYSDATTSEALVVFISARDKSQVVTSCYYDTASTIEYPPAPASMGKSFSFWTVDGTTIATEDVIKGLMANQNRIVVYPVYDQVAGQYTVTVDYVDGSGNTVKEQFVSESTPIGTGTTLRAPEIDGKVFSYWTNENGEIVAYTSEYYVRPTSSITLKAVYDGEKTQVPTVLMTDMYATLNGAKYRVSFTATRSIPDGYSLDRAGIIYIRAENLGQNEDPKEVLTWSSENSNVKYQFGDVAELNSTFTLNINTTDPTRVFYARGFIVVKDPSGNTQYLLTEEILVGCYNSIANPNA